MKLHIPIVLFVFNRLLHTKKTIESLKLNSLANNSPLIIFSDGGRNEQEWEEVYAIRNYLKEIKGFKSVTIHSSEKNIGLATSIINGVTKVFNTYNHVIVLEDDLETSPYFIQFMHDALNYYNPKDIWSIGGYTPIIKIPKSYNKSTFLAYRNCSWGWATWKENWFKTDWNVSDFKSFFINKKARYQFERGGNDLSIMLLKQRQGKINSWSIRFNYSAYKHQLPTVYPTQTLVRNIGVDGSGTNMKKSIKYNTVINTEKITIDTFCDSNTLSIEIESNFKKFYNTSILRYCINKWKILFTKYI